MTTTRTTATRSLAVLAAAGAALAVTAPSASATTTPPACPKASGAQTAFTTTLSNGITKIGKNASFSGASARGCGLLSVRASDGKLVGTIKPGNISFAPVTTKVGLLSLPTTLRAVSNLTGPVAFTTAGQTASLGGKVVATAEVLGAKCDIPLTVTLTTGKSGALKGVPFAFGTDGVGRGKLVANNFSVPKIAATATCNALIATFSNVLVGLPLGPGASSITFDATLKLG